jgi:hypothetical protein
LDCRCAARTFLVGHGSVHAGGFWRPVATVASTCPTPVRPAGAHARGVAY